MFPVRRYLCFTAALALSAAALPAQNVISAKSGLVHYIEGDVAVDNKPVTDQAGVFADVKKDSELTTSLGRAEVLLTPGVFLRVGENSAIRMLNNKLEDTKVEFESGKVMVESDTPMKDNLVTVVYRDYSTTFRTHGLFEFSSEPAQLKVYSGEAEVTAGGQTVIVKEGHILFFSAALASEKFNPKDGDELYRWSKLRSEYISVANVSAARSARDSGFTGISSGYAGGGLGDWYYNPFYDMYTYLPFTGMAYSPFGFGYYSPFTVYRFYNNYGGGGYSPASNYLGYRGSSQSAVVATALTNSTTAVSARSSSGGISGGGLSSAGGGGHAGGHGH